MQTMKTSSISAGKPETNVKNRPTRANGNSSTQSHPTHEEIASLACQLYIQSGRQEGRDAENWLQAEQILRKQLAGQAASPRPQSGRKQENGSKQSSSRQQL
jgi:Protein of unknown function (DUF2934)